MFDASGIIGIITFVFGFVVGFFYIDGHNLFIFWAIIFWFLLPRRVHHFRIHRLRHRLFHGLVYLVAGLDRVASGRSHGVVR